MEAKRIIRETLSSESGDKSESNDKETKKSNILKKINDEISIVSGKYGPYFKYKGKNYSVTKKYKVEDLTIEQVMKIVEYKNKKNNL